MPWSTRVHADDAIVETVYEGLLTARELDAAAARTMALMRELPAR